MAETPKSQPAVSRPSVARQTPSGRPTHATAGGGLNWLPPERSGPPLPKIKANRRGGFRVPPWAAVVAVLACVGVIGWNVRQMFTDDTATPDRIRIGTEIGVELAQRQALKFRAKHGRWPSSLAEIEMDGWALTFRAEDSRFEVSGSDGAGGVIRRTGTLDDVPKAPDATTQRDST